MSIARCITPNSLLLFCYNPVPSLGLEALSFSPLKEVVNEDTC